MDEVVRTRLTAFSGPRVTVNTGKRILRVPMEIGEKVIVPVPPGITTIYARLGAVESRKKKVKVRAGRITKVSFRFGK